MHAVVITEPGAAEVLQIREVPTPEPGPGEVLIKVAAAGVNRPDILQRKGRYPPPPGVSELPGLEVAGTIVSVGPEVSKAAVGGEVCALIAGGGYAEYCVVPAPQCLPIPKGLTTVEAASLPETFFTVWSNLFDRAGLAPGETLLVHGGSSGIGVTAIQLATAMGHEVFVTAGSAEKCAACEKLGAKRAINYKDEDFVAVVKEITKERGVDVILDMIGGDYVARNLEALAEDGRLALISALGGSKVAFNLRDLLVRRLTITGSTLRARSVAFKSDIVQKLREKVWPLLEAGKIKPVIYKTFPLEQAAEAHRLMESSQHIGKIVLVVQ